MCENVWNLREEATMYTSFPSMFPRMGFGYTQVNWVGLRFAIWYDFL
jgi:hypothetical protein